MITRIVKMTFEKDKAEVFSDFVNTIKETVAGFDGCQDLIVYRDIHSPTIFFTYSKWDSEEKLDTYRNSDFFKSTWKQTKEWFAEKAEAWTVEEN